MTVSLFGTGISESRTNGPCFTRVIGYDIDDDTLYVGFDVDSRIQVNATGETAIFHDGERAW